MAGDFEQNDDTHTYVPLTRGMMVGHYRIIEKIGAGGMGEVYLAEDTKLKRQVALKFMPLPYSTDPDARERFKREAQAAAVLNHPNIVTIHEVGEFHGRPYIVMEHCRGRSLRDYLIGKTLTIGQFLDLAAQILEGLHEAHAAGVIHRDLKPSNIMIDEYERPKILDFGLATIRGGEKLTKTGSTLGTIGYMSPEQISGKEVDERSDLFSLGVILYEILARKRPFTGDNDAAILNAVLNETPPPVTTHRPDVPDGVQRIIGRLLEKNLGYRFRSALEVLAELKHRRRTDGQQVLTGSLSGRQRLLFIGLPALAVLIMLLALSIQMYSPAVDETGEPDRKMLAVLPFENLGAPEDEYFADGITDEITSRLGVIKGLGVISRTSAMQYKKTEKGLPEIAGELGVDYILEGTIRWDKTSDTSLVRITPQLIKVSDNTHLWAENYERPLTKIFAIQADIAERIVEKLDIVLQEPARRLIEDRPTENMQAYEYLLRGNEYRLHTFEEEDCRIALEMYEKAVELDSTFAEAYAWLGYSHVSLYWWGYDGTSSRLEKAKTAIDKALDLEPNLPEGHSALAYYHYWGFLDYERALQEMAKVREIRPFDSWDYNGLGAVLRRQGKWEEALFNFERSIELSPRNGSYFLELAITHHMMRHYEEAERFYDISISLTPELTWAYLLKSGMYLSLRGDVDAARRVLNGAAGKVDNTVLIRPLAECDILDREYKSALEQLADGTISLVGDISSYYLGEISSYYLKKALIYHLMDDSSTSTACYDSARIYLENHDRPVAVLHDYVDQNLAMAYAGLGMKEQAISQMNKIAARTPLSLDAFDGAFVLHHCAIVNVMVGEHETALDQLEQLLSINSGLSVALFKIDPRWDPLRDHPRFKALLEKYGDNDGT